MFLRGTLPRMGEQRGKTCFMAMPITTHPHESTTYGDDAHWSHVMEHLFVPAIVAAGFEPVRPISRGSNMIHAEIVKNLEESAMVLCDFSGENPNVFFELGVRTSLDKPIALVRDDRTKIPFDLGGVNAHPYDSGLRPWKLKNEVEALTEHLKQAELTCGDSNPLWRQFGLTIRAQETDPDATPEQAAVTLLREEVQEMRDQLQGYVPASSDWNPFADSPATRAANRMRIYFEDHDLDYETDTLAADRIGIKPIDGRKAPTVTPKHGSKLNQIGEQFGVHVVFAKSIRPSPSGADD